jgi:transcriptional regulator GlxA family with amidase domain
VHLKRQHFITSAGSIYCAASVNALTDLTIHHVHRFFGRDVADHLSHHFSHEVRQSYENLNFNAEANTNHPDEQVLQVQLWLQNNFNRQSISIHALARNFGMSQRTLSRRFKEATNMSPMDYLQQQRYEAARELLQTSNLSIKEIAYRVGYLDVSYFGKLFKQHANLSPRDYRSTVRARLFSSNRRN